MLQITGKGNITYQLSSGVVLGDRFLNQEDFSMVFKQLLKDSEAYAQFNYGLMHVQKINHIILGAKGQVKTVTEFMNQLQAIQDLFSQTMLKGLGGNISLLTTFNMGQAKKQESYYLANENDLPSFIDGLGQKTYQNTQQSLTNLQLETSKLKKINDAFGKHMRGFYQQLVSKNTQNKEQRQALYIWAYDNLRDRYNAINKVPHPVSLARYFWGGGKIQGYTAEAFGTHLSLVHPNVLTQLHAEELIKSSVIAEHGGPGSHDLFSLLASTKGNTMSQLSGDIVVIDGNGNVIFNIQSKASRGGDYSFTITYQRFMQNIMLFKEIYEKFLAGYGNEQDIAVLFNAFATQAWVPIKTQVEKQADEVVNDLIKQSIK